MAFKMKGYSAYDKMEPSGYKKMGSAYDKHGAYKQTDGEKKQIQIEKKPNPDSNLEINDANLQKLATKYEVNINTIKKIISSLDDEAGGDDDYSLPDVEDAIKTFVQTTSNADEVD